MASEIESQEPLSESEGGEAIRENQGEVAAGDQTGGENAPDPNDSSQHVQTTLTVPGQTSNLQVCIYYTSY